MDIKDKAVVITGGSSGLGKALAEVFKNAGGQVLICSNNQAELNQTAQELGVEGVVCDITDPEEVKKLAEETAKKFGRIDIWINNAGVGNHHTAIEDQEPARVHQMMEVNFFGMMYGCQDAFRVMRNQKSGTIINVVSVRAMKAHPLSAGYSATKWAARGFAEALRVAGETEDISVINVYPTGMKTEFFNKNKPEDYGNFLEPKDVATQILKNLELDNPQDDLVIESTALYPSKT